MLNQDDMITLVRNRMAGAPKPEFARFALEPREAGKPYSLGKDKDGLDKVQRNAVEEAKDRLTFPVEVDLW